MISKDHGLLTSLRKCKSNELIFFLLLEKEFSYINVCGLRWCLGPYWSGWTTVFSFCCHQGTCLGPCSHSSQGCWSPQPTLSTKDNMDIHGLPAAWSHADVWGPCSYWGPYRCEWAALPPEATSLSLVWADSKERIWIHGPIAAMFMVCAVTKSHEEIHDPSFSWE